MTIKTSLISVKDAVINGKKIHKGMSVKLPMFPEAEIYGLVAMDNPIFGYSENTPPLGIANVIANRIVFTIGNQISRAPIFNSVSLANCDKYPLYRLYIPTFLRILKDWQMKDYILSMREVCAPQRASKLPNVTTEKHQPDGPLCAYYHPMPEDLYFTSNTLSAIGNDFAIITRRINKESGTLIYEIFPSDEVKIEKPCAIDILTDGSESVNSHH